MTCRKCGKPIKGYQLGIVIEQGREHWDEHLMCRSRWVGRLWIIGLALIAIAVLLTAMFIPLYR